jgi:hypothetical protein
MYRLVGDPMLMAPFFLDWRETLQTPIRVITKSQSGRAHPPATPVPSSDSMDTTEPLPIAVSFVVRCNTQLGDRVVVVGGEPCLGSWDPARGVELATSPASYPIFTSPVVTVPTPGFVAFKFVRITPSGHCRWEEGSNRYGVAGETGVGVGGSPQPSRWRGGGKRLSSVRHDVWGDPSRPHATRLAEHLCSVPTTLQHLSSPFCICVAAACDRIKHLISDERLDVGVFQEVRVCRQEALQAP